jgi:hypothetical protein
LTELKEKFFVYLDQAHYAGEDKWDFNKEELWLILSKIIKDQTSDRINRIEIGIRILCDLLTNQDNTINSDRPKKQILNAHQLCLKAKAHADALIKVFNEIQDNS